MRKYSKNVICPELAGSYLPAVADKHPAHPRAFGNWNVRRKCSASMFGGKFHVRRHYPLGNADNERFAQLQALQVSYPSQLLFPLLVGSDYFLTDSMFKFDPKYLENEEGYKSIKSEILGEESDDG
jgi:hypothetical protein